MSGALVELARAEARRCSAVGRADHHVGQAAKHHANARPYERTGLDRAQARPETLERTPSV